MKKTTVLLSLSASILLLASCSKKDGTAYVDESSLKYMAEKIDANTSWSEPLEAEILSGEVTGCDGISSNVDIEGNMIFASAAEDDYKKVYPYLDGFGSLDVSSLDDLSFDFLHSFCSDVVEGNEIEKYFNSENFFMLVLFNYGYTDNEGKALGFTSYALGEPYIADEVAECPVRFFTPEEGKEFFNEGDPYKDMTVYLINDGNSCKINQIEFK